MLGTVTDEDLVASALKGSNSAWTKLVKRYEKRVYNYALRMVGHPDDAFDLMQEVFVGVHRNLAGFRGDGAFPAWLFRIANFRCTDYLRRRRHTEADRHRVDVRKTKRPDGYDLYEFMSSRLTNVHTHGLVENAKGSEFVVGYNKTPAFAKIEFDTVASPPTVTCKIIDIDNKQHHQFSVTRQQLSH